MIKVSIWILWNVTGCIQLSWGREAKSDGIAVDLITVHVCCQEQHEDVFRVHGRLVKPAAPQWASTVNNESSLWATVAGQ